MTKCFAVKNIHSLPTSRPRYTYNMIWGCAYFDTAPKMRSEKTGYLEIYSAKSRD